MSQELINPRVSPFDAIRQVDKTGREYWSARDLQKLLGYKQWRQFEDAIDRAKTACKIAGQNPDEQIADVRNLQKRGNRGATQEKKDYYLTRYACYLVAMNGDPRKPEIASAQTYFAIKTREAEVAQTNKKPLFNFKYQERRHLNRERRYFGYFPVLKLIDDICVQFQEDLIDFSETSSPDISLGKMIAQWLREQPFYDETLVKQYDLVVYVKNGKQIERACAFYPLAWYPQIEKYASMHYFPIHFPKYISGKYKGILRVEKVEDRKRIAERVNYFADRSWKQIG